MSDENKYEKNSPAYIENLWNEYKKIKGYDEGGEVKPAAKSDSVLDTIGKAISKAFDAPPKPSPTPTPLEEKYKKIREQNRKNFDDPINNPSENYNKPAMADGGKVHKSMAQRQNEDIQVLDESGKVKKTVPKYKSQSSPAKEEDPKPSPSPSPSEESEDVDSDYADSSKPLGKRLKAYGNAIDQASGDIDKAVSSYATGGSVNQSNQQQQQSPGVAPILQIPASGMADGGQVPREKTHNEKIVDILHRVTNPNQIDISPVAKAKQASQDAELAHNQHDPILSMPVPQAHPNMGAVQLGESFNDKPQQDNPTYKKLENYNKGGKIEKVEGEEVPVSASKLESEYAPEEEAAEQSASDSTQGQLEQESQGGPKDESSEEPEVSVDGQDVRQLPADTISHVDALADVQENERDPASVHAEEQQQQQVAPPGAAPGAPPKIPLAGQSAAEAAQTVDNQAAGNPQQGGLLEQLKAAQRKQSNIAMMQGIGEGASLIGAGLAGRGGTKVTPVNPAIFRDANAIAMPMQHFEQQLGIEKQDPNSAISKTYQDHILNGLPNATPQQVANIKGSSAANLDKFLPQQTKLIYGQNAIQAKKDLLNTRLEANKDMNKNKQDFTAVQKDLDRKERDKIAALAQEGMKQRFDTPTLDRITNEVRNDPLVKPVILKKASVDESLNLLDNAKTVHPALLSDANFAFTQAMNLQPGATTQKRYDASKITDLNQRIKAWTANNLNNPNADMRADDPDLYNLLHGYLNSVSEDYGHLIDSTQSTVLNTKKAAYNALGRPGIVKGIDAMQGSLGNAGRGPANAQQNGPAGGSQQKQQGSITVRRKSDGKTKTLAADAAEQYLKDPGYEKVQ